MLLSTSTNLMLISEISAIAAYWLKYNTNVRASVLKI